MSERLDPALRTEVLEQLLVERGLVDPAVLDGFVRTYEQDVGPRNGAQVVARAWTEPDFRDRLLRDGTAAIASMGFTGPQGEHMVVLEQTERTHHVVVCTLCSCYPWPVLGLPPAWYKDPAYRARMVREPRVVLAEMGLDLAPERRIEVWDSSSEVRYLTLPRRPTGTAGWPAEDLAALVSRDAMVGVAEIAPVGAR